MSEQAERIEEIQQQVTVFNELISDLIRIFGMKEIEETLHIDINFAQTQILQQVYIMKEPMMSELGAATATQLSTLTRIVDKLVQKGFVVRKADPSDRRVVRVSLTSRGEEIIKKLEETKRKKIASILERLTYEERRKILEVLQIFHQRVLKEVKDGV